MAESWMEAADQHGIPTAFIVRDGKVAWIGHPMAMDEALERVFRRGVRHRGRRPPVPCPAAYNRKQFAAARLWAEALASDPPPAGNRQSQHRYNAAQGQDKPPLDEAAKAKLRGSGLRLAQGRAERYSKPRRQSQDHRSGRAAARACWKSWPSPRRMTDSYKRSWPDILPHEAIHPLRPHPARKPAHCLNSNWRRIRGTRHLPRTSRNCF